MNLRKKIIESVRSQKINATPAELLMISKLSFRNIRFCYVFPVLTESSFFTADFYIPKHNLLIEIDGGVHDTKEQMKKDVMKDLVYKALGYNVLRIKNSEVDTFNTLTIKKYRKKKLQHEPFEPNYREIRLKNKRK